MVSPSATLMTLPVRATDIVGQRRMPMIKGMIFIMVITLIEMSGVVKVSDGSEFDDYSFSKISIISTGQIYPQGYEYLHLPQRITPKFRCIFIYTKPTKV